MKFAWFKILRDGFVLMGMSIWAAFIYKIFGGIILSPAIVLPLLFFLVVPFVIAALLHFMAMPEPGNTTVNLFAAGSTNTTFAQKAVISDKTPTQIGAGK